MVYVAHDVTAKRLDVGQVRNPIADAVEVVKVEIDICFVSDGEQVQDRIRRAAQRHHDGDRVLERRLGEDLPGGNPLTQQTDDGFA